MTGLASVDFTRLRIDEESFVGQAVALGVEYRKLPEHTAEGLQAYLRIHAMSYGTKNRSGMAIEREEIERGVYQVIVCLDLGLESASDGDLNAAVDLIGGGDFETIRKEGWEIAHRRLSRMRLECGQLAQGKEASFFQDCLKDTRIWANVEPGTWQSTNADGEPVGVDPTGDWDRFRDLAARLHLFRALPEDAFRAFRSAAGGRGNSDEVLRNVVVALASQSPSLVLTKDALQAFCDRFKAGRIPDGLRRIIHDQIAGLIDASEPDPEITARIPQAVSETLDEIEAFDPPTEKLFVMAKDRKKKGRRRR